ncbi:MAG: phenylalanine--tRNA ligase beta subunit [Candidatus Parcubacteria bacterium]|nr:MAG: phenylalanine--tRNA ligase beta subunit [Candidatus Parcubacteria bacterium]
MKFRLQDLREFLGPSKINWKKVVDLLNRKSFESYLGKNYLEVEILPNRFSDSGNIRGLAREISLVSNLKFKDLNFNFKELKDKNLSIPIVEVKTQNCNYYFGKVISNIKNRRSPKWLREFLSFYNINSINFLVDLSNYVMIKIGSPLHIFDLDKINKKIIIRQANKNEKFLSLKGKEFYLTNDDIVIADSEKIIALAGIQGSKYTEISLDTKNIFVESAVFNNFNIYKTSRRLNLITEASYRFERSVIPQNSLLGLNYFCYLVQKELSGKIINHNFVYEKKIQKDNLINFSLTKLFNYYPEQISKYDIINILKKLGCRIIKDDKKCLIVQTPNYRLDLNSDVDLIEEIIRLIGYEKLKFVYPTQFSYPQENKEIVFVDYLKNLLIKLGFTEIMSYNFIDDNDVNNFKNFFDFSLIEIINPNSNLYKFYRPFIFINLIKAIEKNISFYSWLEKKEFKVFEIGKIAFSNKKNKINEFTNLAFIVASSDLKKAYSQSRGALTKIFEKLNLDNYFIDHKNIDTEFEIVGEIIVNNKKIGYFIIPKDILLKKYNIEQNLVIIEFSLLPLIDYFLKETKFTPIPKFPAIFRDISFLIPIYLQNKELESEIANICGNILEKIEIIDVYYLSDKEKSITFHLVFRRSDRTLKDEEVNEIIEKVIKHLSNKFNIKVR